MPSSVQHSIYQTFFVMEGGNDSSTLHDDSSTVGVGGGGPNGTGVFRGTGGGYGGTDA